MRRPNDKLKTAAHFYSIFIKFIMRLPILLLTAALTFVNAARNRNRPTKSRKRKQKGPSARRMLYATKIKTDKPQKKNTESESQNDDATTEAVGTYVCDFSADNRTMSLHKIDQIMASNINNKQERLQQCRIISNSCFPATIRELRDSSMNGTASYEEQRSNLYKIREKTTLERDETRLLVVSALRCDWILNNRLCLFEDTPDIAKEKLVYFRTIFDLAEPGSNGYQLIEKQKNLCQKMSERQTDDPELHLDEGEPEIETEGTFATENTVAIPSELRA